MQVNSTLFSLSSQVASYKPNTNKTQVQRDLNARVRALLDYRTAWSALITPAVVNIPQSVTRGGVTMTSGSTNIIGTGTIWPYADRINTTMLNGNRTTGYVEITPASMANIAVDSLLYINDGAFSEVVPVVEVSNSTFTALFQFQHNDGSTLTMSSLAGLQFQLSPFNPIYTLLGVSSAIGNDNTGIINLPFGGQTITNSGYTLLMAYVTIDPNFRSWVQAWDPTQGIPLATGVSQAELNSIDAQRTSQGNPQGFVDLAPNVAGSMQFELWPYQTGPYSIPVLYNRQWPEMKKPTDRPPYFINPSVIIDGAIADALRRKDIRTGQDNDPYFNPNLAKDFENKFALGAQLAAAADEEKCQAALTSSSWQAGNVTGNAAYWQSHVGGPYEYAGW